MPTYEVTPRFTSGLDHLTSEQRQQFRRVVHDSFVPDLRAGLREAREFAESWRP